MYFRKRNFYELKLTVELNFDITFFPIAVIHEVVVTHALSDSGNVCIKSVRKGGASS